MLKVHMGKNSDLSFKAFPHGDLFYNNQISYVECFVSDALSPYIFGVKKLKSRTSRSHTDIKASTDELKVRVNLYFTYSLTVLLNSQYASSVTVTLNLTFQHWGQM